MSPFHMVLLCTLVQTSWGIDRSFPPYFKFGAATSAYQVEGGWNADGKGENMWDRYVHEHPEDVRDNATGDVAADSYHLWREDVKAAIQMGLQMYRFSINWPRILPSGFTNEVNKAGVKYYSDLIDALLAAGIEPVVTLYHWELPVKIQDLGGWTNPLIVDWFGDYARVIFSLYADRVKTWLTINEPISFCDFFYNSGNFAPGIKDTVFAPYLCNKHILLAHAKAYRIFDEEFRPGYKGRISLANHLVWIEPATSSDTALAELGRQHLAGRYSHPIFSKKGGWPTSIEKLMLNVSLRQGYKTSRLPPFSEEEKAFVKGTADFYAMNYYTTYTIRPARRAEQPGYWFITGSPDLNVVLEHPPGAKYGSASIMPIVPEGIRKQMAWLKKQYGDIDILITENGYSSTGSQLDDYNRVNYIKEHLKQILLSINVDKVRVVGYTAWSLIDNFEWVDGYMTKFGLYEVDFKHPNRTRTPRVSARYYACVIAKRSLHVPDSCYKNKLHDSDSCYNKKLNDPDSCYTKDSPVSRYRRMQQRNSGLKKNGGTPDFFGLNYYTIYTIRPAKPKDNIGFCFRSGSPELNAIMEKPRDAYYGATTLLPVVPKDLRQMTAWLQRHYGDDIIDGFTSSGNQLDDHDRMDFFKEHLEQVLLSMKVDNVSVTGYAAWSLIALIQRSWGIDTSFPPNFKFGASSSAYQIEGGWDADGKGENIWDWYVHEYPGDVHNDTGDVAADSYHLWREDVKAAAELGLQFYRFSINWPRILPTGFPNKINEAGVKYYSDLIDALLAKGIEPIVTLHHWELPMTFQKLGGWTNPLIVKWFGDYARVIYSLYADRVKVWLTINEPTFICDISYNNGVYPPKLREPEVAAFLCNRHAMLAHAKAYRIFDQEFRPKYTGRISISNNVLWIEPATPDDEALAELGREYQYGRYSHPIFSKEGGWPPSIEKLMLEVSLRQGYKESRLPPFTKEEIEYVKGTADFFGINHYATHVVRLTRPGDKPGIWLNVMNATLESPVGATFGANPSLPVYPKGLRKVLSWLKQHYGDIEILITENGYSTYGYNLDDHNRTDFIKECLEQVLLSIKVDNVSVAGYSVWSLVDSFEWLHAYTTLVQTSWGIDRSFPPYFKFGAATAAYQVEGGWNADGKGENMWDRYVHEHPEDVRDNATGDVAADSYHLWREDVKAAIQMGLQTYRFSINWPRILPSGFTNEVNEAGVKYYSDLINALLAAGIEPVVTLYHWELPVKIRDLGSWTNPLIVDWFGDYARVIFSLYADRVKTWLTINEPISICDYFYNSGNFAPRIKDPVFAPYLCNKHILLSHAKAYRIFDKEFRPRYKGRISLANHLVWIEPATPNDTALAELGREHLAGRFSHPIFSKKGGWPTSIEKLMLNLSLRQGYQTSRLPSFSEEEKAFVKGTADFYAMNYYTTFTIRPARRAEQPGNWFITGSPELNAVLEHPPGAKYGSAPIMPIVPEGIRKQMAWLKKQYGDIDIMITENGYSSTGSQLHDYDRVNYIKEHLKQILLSVKVDKVRVVGYMAWSLIDSFEWLDGYMTKFGLYQIDFEHPNRTRTPRVSAHYYACVIARRSLHVPDSCYNKKLRDPDSCYTKNCSARRYRYGRMQERNSGRRENGGLYILILNLLLSFVLNL